jgi:hypothetical protein
MLVAVAAIGVVVVALGVVVAVGTASSDPTHSALLSVDIRALPIGAVQPVEVRLPGANAGTGRVFVVRESAGVVVAFVGRSTASTACRLTWAHDADRALVNALPAAEFEDPCGAAYYTSTGACIAGACRGDLDHFTPCRRRTLADQPLRRDPRSSAVVAAELPVGLQTAAFDAGPAVSSALLGEQHTADADDQP